MRGTIKPDRQSITPSNKSKTDMLSRRNILQSIEECENNADSFQNCQKLATLFTIYDHLYAEPSVNQETIREVVIEDYGDDEFYSLIAGKNADQVWNIMNELMQTLKAINPALYNAVLRKLQE